MLRAQMVQAQQAMQELRAQVEALQAEAAAKAVQQAGKLRASECRRTQHTNKDLRGWLQQVHHEQQVGVTGTHVHGWWALRVAARVQSPLTPAANH